MTDPDTAQGGTGHYDGPCCDPQCSDSTWDHPCPVPPLGWAAASRVATDALLDIEARRSALAEREAGTGALDAAIEAAWVDSSRHRLLITGTPGASGPYAPTRWNCDCGESGDGGGIEASKHVVASGVHAAAPLIPVSEQQRADIERDALLRAAENVPPYVGRYGQMIKGWLRRRAASVGTEEGKR